ncbi:MAG: class F420-dependent enzyme [Amycolatopsis sp.]|jgi:PPOX class probable F420-dependent enzyme|uniref:PPOX class F420-dependent oxidoreductase n=1 Tax=Amycolatopsis sp. TaxID=37632 RepID=UPI00262B661A|nr:PPOX class F420-dependent oxidoreductase [Amycolatopsis sp.]MCU1684141.1 class F420-dependent enzyme [Amycolatopsis sp.]
MGIPLSDAVRDLVDGKNYATLATINADGGPQTSAMWVGRDGDELLFSTVAGRLKDRNMRRDPRVSVTIMDRADPERYTEIRGRVTITSDGGRELDDTLSWKYDGKDAGEDAPGAVRVVVRVAADKVTGHVS